MTLGTQPPAAGRSLWWHEAPDAGADRRLVFCFHHAGGAASAFFAWRKQAHARGLRLVACQLPGHGTRLREPAFTRLEGMVPALAAEIAERAAGEPFALFGHSLGGLIAFELARALQAGGLPPAHLFVASFVAPDRYRELRPHKLSDLSDAELVERLARYGGTPPEFLKSAEWLEMILPVLRTDFGLIDHHRHRPGPDLACPITVFGGEGDADYPPAWLHHWDRHTAGGLSVRTYPGGHFFLHQHTPSILDAMAAALASRRGTV